MGRKFRVILLSVLFALVFGCSKDKDGVSEEDNATEKAVKEIKQMDAEPKKVKLTTSMRCLGKLSKVWM